MVKKGESLKPERQDFTVIGSGIIGLLSAHELARQGHKVKVISTEGQPDGTRGSTSVVAGAQFLPWLPDAHRESLTGDFDYREATETPRAFYAELAKTLKARIRYY